MPRHLLRTALLPLLATLALVPTALTAGEADGGEALPAPAAMVTRHVPALSEADVEGLQPYENLRSAGLADWHPSERRLLITTRFAETRQLHEVDTPLGARRQITFFDEPIGDGRYRPGQPQQIAFSRDEGGSENYQIFLLDRRQGRLRRLTDGVHRHEGLLWSPDGRRLAYVGNARNGRDMDLYVIEPGAGEARLVAETKGLWFPADWSPDGRRLLLIRFVSVSETYLYIVEVETGAVTALTPEDGEPAAYFGSAFAPDGGAVYTVTNRDSEFLRLVRIDLESREETLVSGGVSWDVEGFDVTDDGALLAFFTNEDGLSKLHLLDPRSGEELPGPELPPGVVGSGQFRPGGHELAFTLSWARSPSDVYSYDPESRRLERWTASEVGGLDTESFVTPELIRYPTFDRLPAAAPDEEGPRRTIPAFVYRPSADRHPGPRPVYVTLHGGPESQWRPRFLGSNNFLLNELGIALVYPNVRGSTGYGRTYVQLDNGPLREDSVRDVGALLDWIATQPDLDASRVMVGGGSYGGYMSLASLVFYSDRLAGGFDAVGISNFVTFLTNTKEYRRDLRRQEYGDERDPEMRRLLEKFSPIQRVAQITKPLLVAQGANDPRVPVSESDQIVAALEEQGTPVWYMVAEDEGHGFRKKANSDYLRAVWIEFMRRYLLGEAPEGALEAAPAAPAVGASPSG